MGYEMYGLREVRLYKDLVPRKSLCFHAHRAPLMYEVICHRASYLPCPCTSTHTEAEHILNNFTLNKYLSTPLRVLSYMCSISDEVRQIAAHFDPFTEAKNSNLNDIRAYWHAIYFIFPKFFQIVQDLRGRAVCKLCGS
jgi:hypothetical protein